MAWPSFHVMRHLSCRGAVLNRESVLGLRWGCVATGNIQLQVVERKPLVLKASEFQHFFEVGPTEKVYAGTPVHQ